MNEREGGSSNTSFICGEGLLIKFWSRREELNTPSADYRSAALTLSYTGTKNLLFETDFEENKSSDGGRRANRELLFSICRVTKLFLQTELTPINRSARGQEQTGDLFRNNLR
jgi:hypothetical protein